MEKYLGNKRSLLKTIDWFIEDHCPDAKSLFDAFAGTTNVSRYFRRNGFDVVANDINRFSYVLGSTYLTWGAYPRFSNLLLPRTPTTDSINKLWASFESSVRRDKDTLFPESAKSKAIKGLSRTARILAFLNELPEREKLSPGPIFEYYSIWGSQSEYKSVRGTVGKRNYFSQTNALHLDAILCRIRRWWKDGSISKKETLLLLASVIEEVTIIANVNGTFHDFNREKLWPNSLQPLNLRLPLVHPSPAAAEVFSADAPVIAPSVMHTDVLYLDPPYNFRQYSSYYHLLNFIAAYPFLPSIEDYLSEITHVRGQNPNDDFRSSFSSRDSFIESLRQLIRVSNAKYVVMNYYGGRNHWNHWSTGDLSQDAGFKEIKSLFSDKGLFSEFSSASAMQLRQNYQSRNGESKSFVNEYLFYGKIRRQPVAKKRLNGNARSPQNLHLGIDVFRREYKARKPS